MHSYRLQTNAFTLVELLVVFAIIALLAALLFPIFHQAREKAHQSVCLSNIKQISLAISLYAIDNDQIFPSLVYNIDPFQSPNFTGVDGLPGKYMFWMQAIYPYVSNLQVFTCPDKADSGWKGSAWDFLPDDPRKTGAAFMYYGYGRAFASHNVGLTENAYSKVAQTIALADTDIPHDFGVRNNITYILYWKINAGAAFDTRHTNGVNCGFLDGHAQWLKLSYTPMPLSNNSIINYPKDVRIASLPGQTYRITAPGYKEPTLERWDDWNESKTNGD